MPAYRFRGVHMLLIELHLSSSTLLMLIAGPERIKGRRRPHAAGYRFFSYGDVCSSPTATSAHRTDLKFGRDHYSTVQSAPCAASPISAQCERTYASHHMWPFPEVYDNERDD